MSEELAWDLKVVRARLHLAELQARIGAFLDSEPYALQLVREQDRQGLRLSVRDEPSPELGLLVGDVVHNLRSALEARFFACAEARLGPMTESQEAAIALPLVETPEALAKLEPRWRKLFGQDAIQLMGLAKILQPFSDVPQYWADRHGESVAETQREHHVATWNRLVRLSRLSNLDKHRRLQLPWWSVKDTWAWSTEAQPSFRFWIAPGPWVDGQEIISIEGESAGADGVGLHAKLTVVLPGERSMGGSAADALENIVFFVERAIEVLGYQPAS